MVPKQHIAEREGGRRASGPAAIVVLALGRGDLRERARRGLQIGGKAEALDQLARAGLPVPPGWVVPTDGYRSWLDAGIEPGLRRLGRAIAAEAALPDLLRALEEEILCSAAARCAQAVLEQSIPRRLRDRRFAARSSAVGEDGAAHSFAGIYESFPGLRWEETGAGVVLCWASAFTPRADEYRDRVGMTAAEAPVAVVVQPLVEARAAGVAFTADPTTGSRTHYLINATLGLGTSLVDGRVQPDQYRVPKLSPAAKKIRIVLGSKEVRELPRGYGLAAETVPEAEREQPALPRPAILELARLLERLEKAAGAPQDVEWAWDGNRFTLLQARPITHLPAQPGPVVEWSRTNYRELYPELPLPLTGSYMSTFEKYWGTDYFLRRGCDTRDLGPFLKIYQGRPMINLSVLKYVTLSLGGEIEDGLGEFGTTGEADADLVVPEASLLRKAAIGLRYWRGRQTAVRTLRYIARRLRAMESVDPEGLSDVALLDQMQEFYLQMQPVDDGANDLGGALSLRRLLLEALVGNRFPSLDQFLNDVTVSGPENVSVAQALELLRLSALAREDEETRAFFLGPEEELRGYWAALASQPFLEEFRDFLKGYGHRSLHESDSSVPRFREDPMPILRAIAAAVRSPQVEMPAQRLHRQRAAAAAAWARLRASLPAWERWLPFRELLARQTVRTVQRLMRYRERLRSEMARLIGERRRLELALGRRWCERGFLDHPSEVYWLQYDELRRAAEERSFRAALRTIIRDRKAEWERLAQLGVPNVMLETPDGFRAAPEASPVEASDEDGLVLRGQPVSSGITEGEVRVIRSPEDAAGMAPGTILVSPVVGPSWGPLYSLAGGLIVEMGGTLSHGAILAREYGLPAVTNIPGATRALKTGDRVLLNANIGVVWRAPERGAAAE